MKKIVCVATILLTALVAICQESKPSYPSADYDLLIQQSKKKKTEGILLSVAGGAMQVGGGICMVIGVTKSEDIYDPGTNTYTKTKKGIFAFGVALAATGFLVDVGSISFYKKSRRLKEEANKMYQSSLTPIILPDSISAQVNKTKYEDLLSSAKRHKKAGVITAVTGVVFLAGGGALISKANLGTDYTSAAFLFGGIVSGIIGFGACVASIPMLVKANKLEKLAEEAKLSLRTQLVPYSPGQGRVNSVLQPQLTLSIPLGR